MSCSARKIDGEEYYKLLAELLSGEEAEVFSKIFKNSRKAFYSPKAKIWHRVSPERKTRRWLFRRIFWDGATQPILDSGIRRPKMVYLMGAYYDLRRCMRFFSEALLALTHTDKNAFLDSALKFDQRLGRLYMHICLAIGKTF